MLQVSIIEVANASCQLKYLSLDVESKTLAILNTSWCRQIMLGYVAILNRSVRGHDVVLANVLHWCIAEDTHCYYTERGPSDLASTAPFRRIKTWYPSYPQHPPQKPPPSCLLKESPPSGSSHRSCPPHSLHFQADSHAGRYGFGSSGRI